MTVGEKIRYYRELNGFSKRELGLRAGFSFSTAAVRISQYESEQTIPREEVLAKIATALNVDISALTSTSINTREELMHTLFELKDIYNLKVAKKDKSYVLLFDDLENTDLKLQIYLKAWLDKQEQLDMGVCSKKEYDLWCAKFPDVAEVNINEDELKAQLAEKEKELEIQLDELRQETAQKKALLKAIQEQICK